MPVEVITILMKKIELHKELIETMKERDNELRVHKILIKCAAVDIPLLRLIPNLESVYSNLANDSEELRNKLDTYNKSSI